MSTSTDVQSEAWRHQGDLQDFRSEWLSEVLVERATVASGTIVQGIPLLHGNRDMAQAGFVWIRFWYRHDNQLFEKYFDARQKSLGIYAPVCMPFKQNGKILRTVTLYLGLWLDTNGRVTVLGEEAFDDAAAARLLSPVQIEQAEHRIRELTRLVVAKKSPPAMVRNFTLAPESTS